ncbi:MAG: hypothetical protein M0021_16255 [Clostridia bacterium]|nr:hypothetical protein [Clostridia bacterium]
MSVPDVYSDPFQYFKKIFEATEESWSKAMEKYVGTEAYAAQMGSYLDSYLFFNQLVQGNLTKYWESLKLPTQNDVTRVAKQIIAVESKMDDLAQKVDQILDSQNQTREELGLQEKVACLEELVAELRDKKKSTRKAGAKETEEAE